MAKLAPNDRLSKVLNNSMTSAGYVVVGLEDFPNTTRIRHAGSGTEVDFTTVTPTVAQRVMAKGFPYLQQGEAKITKTAVKK